MLCGGREQVWRGTLVMRDEAPFEAAAFLEHLHRSKASAGRALDWNPAWARLRCV